MPHKNTTLELQTPPKKFGKTKAGKVLKLPTHVTTSKLHALEPEKKKVIIQAAYTAPTQTYC
jgi:hypothetical protein